MPTIERISTLQYMGSKSRMLDKICAPIIEDSNVLRVVDLFAGTGSVGYALSPYKSIISNDIEYYSYVLNEAILNGCLMGEDELAAFFQKAERKYHVISSYLSAELSAEATFLSAPVDDFEEYATFSNATPSVFNNPRLLPVFKSLGCLVDKIRPGKSDQDVPFPCLFTTYFANAYFGINQCCQIDALASAINELTNERQRFVLLSALMTATSTTASSTTHFAQFLTVKSKSTFKNLKEKRSSDIFVLFKESLSRFQENGLLGKPEKSHKCFNLDFEDCLQTIAPDEHTLVYADPPYFKEHYSRYYHVLNTLCLSIRISSIIRKDVSSLFKQIVEDYWAYLSTYQRYNVIKWAKEKLKENFSFDLLLLLLQCNARIDKEIIGLLKKHLNATIEQKSSPSNASGVTMVYPTKDPYEELNQVGYWCLIHALPQVFSEYLGISDRFDFYYLYKTFDFGKFDPAWLLYLNAHALKAVSKNGIVREKIRLRIADTLNNQKLEGSDNERLRNILSKYFC